MRCPGARYRIAFVTISIIASAPIVSKHRNVSSWCNPSGSMKGRKVDRRETRRLEWRGPFAPQGPLRPMFLNRSAGRRFVITSIAVVTFAGLYEVTVLDSRFAARQSEQQELTGAPAPGVRLRFTATGYCRGTTTASGVNVRSALPPPTQISFPSVRWCGSRISRQPITASIR